MIGRFGDFTINCLFTNTFSCVSVRTVSGSGGVSLPFHDPRRLACQVFLCAHHRSRSLLRSDSIVHVLLVSLQDLLSLTSASVGSRRLS